MLIRVSKKIGSLVLSGNIKIAEANTTAHRRKPYKTVLPKCFMAWLLILINRLYWVL
jgi:hypothetical protein